MKKPLAKTLFDEGVLRKAVATQGIGGGFNLAFTKESTGDSLVYLETDRNDTRQFKTADALLRTAREIGFQKIEFWM